MSLAGIVKDDFQGDPDCIARKGTRDSKPAAGVAAVFKATLVMQWTLLLFLKNIPNIKRQK